MEWSFFSQTDPLFFHKKTAAPLKNCFTESAVFYFSILFFIFLYSSKISDILSMLYRGMFVIQSCCLKSDMDVLTAYFGLYLSQKSFRLLAFKFSQIFGLSRFFGSVPQISPFFIFLWYVFNLCKLVMSHILALSLLLSHIDLFSYCYVN